MTRKIVVGILSGGPSGEHYLSIRSSEVIIKNLDKTKYDFISIIWLQNGTVRVYEINSSHQIKCEYRHIVSYFENCSIDIIYNTLHGEKENYGRINGLLELMGIPYTGNGMYTSILGINKNLSKIMFTFLNVPTIDFITIEKYEMIHVDKVIKRVESKLRYPLILKPCLGGSSIGINVVDNQDGFIESVDRMFYSHTVILVENFVKGKEFSVGVFGTKGRNDFIALPVARIDYDGLFFDAAIKHDDTYKVVIPSDCRKEVEEKLYTYAVMIHSGMGFDAFSRTDFIVDPDDNVYALEVNTHPGFSEYSIIPNMLRHTTLSIPQVIDKLIENGISRRLNIYE